MRSITFPFKFILTFLLLAGALAWSASPRAELSEPMVLVAKPELVHPLYRQTVLVVKPFGANQHIGFIVNRPTNLTLGKMFPDHAPSQKVPGPVYLGGPVDAQMMFALVERQENPGGSAVEIMPGLYAVFDAPTVDKMIESHPDQSRFVVGLVVWRPGELAAEIEQGAWYRLKSDPEIVLRDPEGLWEELMLRSREEERRKKSTVQARLVLP